MDERLIRKYVRSLITEMGHYAPVKAKTAAQLPHMVKGHESTFEESLSVAVDACRELGDLPFLYRAHRTKSKSTGIVVVKAEPGGWRRGRMGLTLKLNPAYNDFMEKLTDSLGFTNIVYTSFGSGRSQFGSPEVFLPLPPYEIAWNPQVRDVYADFLDATKSGEDPSELIGGYRKGWPTAATVGTEVLVDVDKYMLLSPSIMSHTLFYRDKVGASKLARAATYGELADALSSVTR